MVVAALYFLLGAIKSLDQCSCDCGKWCIKGKQDTVNGNCTVCDWNPWCVVGGLMYGLSLAKSVDSSCT